MSATQEKVSHTTEGWRVVSSDDLEGYSIVDSRGTVVAEYVPSKELADLIASAPGMTKFKAYVHKRLDDAGIPADPESPHRAEGCRIGGRLDIALALASATPSLISAAPDLLAACQAWVDYFDRLTRDDEPGDRLAEARMRTHGPRVEATRAAIARATGGNA